VKRFDGARMISIRRTFIPKIILLGVVACLCIFYIRNLNNFNANSEDKTKSTNSVPQQQRLIQEPDQIQEPENDVQLVNEPDTSKKQLNKYELEIQRDLLKQKEIPKLGEGGKIAHLQDPDDIAEGEKQLSKIALNQALSEHISYNRTVPDARHPGCRKKSYDVDSLLTTSVIIIFFNEPYSVLIRTVHSVINTSPKNLLREVILVDDGSSNVDLKHKLDYYVSSRLSDKVKIVRLTNR
jgi:polypeptide N-acetylgalactosaminyltransferase